MHQVGAERIFAVEGKAETLKVMSKGMWHCALSLRVQVLHFHPEGAAADQVVE
jgi:hypothetical protein